MGGPTKDVEPVPILLQSGDVVIMSGEARRAFHGVPKILRVKCNCQSSKDRFLSSFSMLQASNCPWARELDRVTQPEFSETDQEFILKYLDRHRININVRQVH